MSSIASFASALRTLDEAPEPFRGATRHALGRNEPLQFLVFGPAYRAMGIRWPASLLVVAQTRWLLAIATRAGGEVTLDSASFADTLIVRLESVRLNGHLRIDHWDPSGGRTSSAQFNTAVEHLYRHAVNLLLDGMEAAQSRSSQETADADIPTMGTWPLKFQSKVPGSVPPGRHLLTAVYWPAIHGLFHRERVPAAALAVTDRDLLIVADDRTWRLPGITPTYGTFTTYIPLIRLGEFRIAPKREVDTLEVDVRTSGGRTSLKVQFPDGQHEAIQQVMNFALRQRSVVTEGCPSRTELYPQMGQ